MSPKGDLLNEDLELKPKDRTSLPGKVRYDEKRGLSKRQKQGISNWRKLTVLLKDRASSQTKVTGTKEGITICSYNFIQVSAEDYFIDRRTSTSLI